MENYASTNQDLLLAFVIIPTFARKIGAFFASVLGRKPYLL